MGNKEIHPLINHYIDDDELLIQNCKNINNNYRNKIHDLFLKERTYANFLQLQSLISEWGNNINFKTNTKLYKNLIFDLSLPINTCYENLIKHFETSVNRIYDYYNKDNTKNKIREIFFKFDSI